MLKRFHRGDIHSTITGYAVKMLEQHIKGDKEETALSQKLHEINKIEERQQELKIKLQKMKMKKKCWKYWLKFVTAIRARSG